MYGFDNLRGIQSVIVHPVVSAENVTTLLTSCVTFVHRVLNNGVEVISLEACYRLIAVLQLHVEKKLESFQRHIQSNLTILEEE